MCYSCDYYVISLHFDYEGSYMKITEYQLLYCLTPEDLEDDVNKAIIEGMQPFGSPFQTNEEKDQYYCQALVKYEATDEC